MKRIIYYFKKDIVLTVSWVLAAASAFLVRPDKGYAGYIDWRSLGILWSLMIITKGYMNNGIFEKIGHDNIHRYTSIKKGINKGKWPDDFLKELAKPETVSENTHFNKDGAMLITKGLVELIRESKNHQLGELQSSLLHNVV